MRNLFISAASIVFVGAAAVAATGAFFSDTETSTGNTFTAGAINLTVDSTQHYNNAICVNGLWQLEPNATTQVDQYPVIGTACEGSWSATDLGAQKFFNFADVKPGDRGENTVSLHIDNNPAWACVNIKTTANDENTILEPETTAGDLGGGPIGDGELAGNLKFQTWLDQGATPGFQGSQTDLTEGDNLWQVGEPALASGALSSITGNGLTLTLADGATGTPLPPLVTNYIGMFWCAGTVTGGAGNLGCDGSTMDNKSMTDSAMVDVAFTVEQARNNSTFRCNQPIVVTANDLETSLANVITSGKWYFYDDTSDVLNNALGAFGVGPSTPPLGTGSAQNLPLAGANGRTLLTNSSFGGTLLSSISQMGYSAYQPSGAWSANEAPFFRFNVDFTGSNIFQNSLVYVPSTNGAVTQNTWQTWDMIQGGNALWLYSGAFWPAGVTTLANTVPGTTARTWTAILADYPNIRMWQAGAQLGFRTGEPGPAGLTAYIDNFTINTGTGLKTYNFGN